MNILKEITCHCRFLTGGDVNDVDNARPLNLETVKETSRIIAKELIVKEILKESSSSKNQNHVAVYVRTMSRVVRDLLNKHEIVFEKNVRSIVGMSENGVSCVGDGLNSVVGEMFKDGQKNWGRVVAVYAFSYSVASYCAQHGLSNMVECIADVTGNCVADHLSEWILNQGGWDSFEKQFHQEESTESKIWTGLMCTFVGLGTLATITALK